MFLERRTTLAVIGLLGLAACTADGTGSSPPDPTDAGSPTGGADAGPVPTDAGPSFAASAKGRVRFKGAERMRNDLAQALELTPAEVCQELGQYDCVDYVHTIALGGVEPYSLGINEPLDNTTATTPLAVERVVLSACGARVDRDLSATDDALIYRGITADAAPEPAEVERALTTLYRRALLRDPKPAELAHLEGLLTDLTADGLPGATRDWAVLSCFAVLTSVEALFY